MKDEEHMDCQRADELMIDFLYEEIEPDLRAELTAHLERCPRCAEEVRKLGGVQRLMRAVPSEEPVPELDGRVLEAARHLCAPVRPWWSFHWLQNPAVVSAMLVLVVIGVGLAVIREEIREESGELTGGELVSPASKEEVVSAGAPEPASEATRAELPAAARPASPPVAEVAASEPADLPKPVDLRSTKSVSVRPAKTPPRLAVKTDERPVASEAFQSPAFDRDIRSKKKIALSEESVVRRERADGAADEAKGRFAVPPPAPEGDLAAGLIESAPRSAVPPPVVKQEQEPAQQEQEIPQRPKSAERAEAPGGSAGGPREATANEKDEEDLFGLASRELEQGRYAQAVDAYRAFLRRSPGDRKSAVALFDLGRALFLLERCVEAVSVFEEAHRRHPAHRRAAEMMFDWASCLIRLGRTAEALKVYEGIEREHPTRREEARREILRWKR